MKHQMVKILFFNDPIISPPIFLDFDVSTISSYYLCHYNSILITKNGEIFATGENSEGQINGSLPREIIKKLTKFDIKDGKSHLFRPISAISNEDSTLFLVANPENSNETRLALSYKNRKEDYPLFLNVQSAKLIALFGSRMNFYAIDEEGDIISVPISSLEKNPNQIIKAQKLSDHGKIASIAFNNKNFCFLDSNGTIHNPIDKKICKKIQGLKFISISGYDNNIFAVSEDGRVFGYGDNTYGQLGIGKETKFVKEFTEIKSLSKYKIKAVYAGMFHTLFQTEEGKILACGGRTCGEIPGIEPSQNPLFLPIETSIKSGATFCIAELNVTAIFTNYVPPHSPNKPINFNENLSTDETTVDVYEENRQLKEEIAKLRAENEKLRSKNDQKTVKKVEILDQVKINELTRIEQLGKGAQSEVFKVSKPQEFALKIFAFSQGSGSDNENFKKLKRFLTEIDILQHLHHPNIIESFGFCFGDERNSPSILLEFCTKNLKTAIKSMEPFERICAIFEICLGMEALHAANMIHRDLKPENILIDLDGHVKISDFGVSCIIDVEDQTKSLTAGIGTFKFMAPELLNERTDYNNKVDVYSFGVVAFFVLTGGEMPKISMADQSNGKKAPIPKSVNKVSKDLIEMCWSQNPDDRPSFSEIIEIIKSNNFKLIDDEDDDMVPQIKSFLKL